VTAETFCLGFSPRSLSLFTVQGGLWILEWGKTFIVHHWLSKESKKRANLIICWHHLDWCWYSSLSTVYVCLQSARLVTNKSCELRGTMWVERHPPSSASTQIVSSSQLYDIHGLLIEISSSILRPHQSPKLSDQGAGDWRFKHRCSSRGQMPAYLCYNLV